MHCNEPYLLVKVYVEVNGELFFGSIAIRYDGRGTWRKIMMKNHACHDYTRYERGRTKRETQKYLAFLRLLIQAVAGIVSIVDRPISETGANDI